MSMGAPDPGDGMRMIVLGIRQQQLGFHGSRAEHERSQKGHSAARWQEIRSAVGLALTEWACHDPGSMSTPRIHIALLLCCVLALVRVLGIHVHMAHTDHDQGAATHDFRAQLHDSGRWLPVNELGDHADAHIIGAEIDADSPQETTGRLPSQDLLALTLVCAFALLIIVRRTAIRSLLTVDSPPPRRKCYVLPLSQAPPRAG